MKNIPQAYRPSYLWFWPPLILGGSVISAGTIHDLRRVKVPGTGPLWNPCDISRGLMTRAIWKRPCINLFITYFVRADNMLLPFTRGQKTCYCPRKMLLPRRQITRRKWCFYYTCKFSVISIKYVININIEWSYEEGKSWV
jgi:hypothetical protein